MNSSAEKEGSEDCRGTGIGNREDFKVIGSEDCRAGGNISFEEFGVGGCVDSIVCGVVENTRHCDISHMNMLQRTMGDRRSFLQSWSSEMCQIDCHQMLVIDIQHVSMAVIVCLNAEVAMDKANGKMDMSAGAKLFVLRM